MAGHVPRAVSVVLMLVVICQVGCSPTRSALSTAADVTDRYKKQISPSDESNAIDVNDSVRNNTLKLNLKQGRIEAKQGGSMEYICEAKGSPSPSIVWLKNGLPIVDNVEDFSDNYIVVDNKAPLINSEGSIGIVKSNLYLPCVTMKDSGTVYGCMATAGNLRAIERLQLRVSASQDNYYHCFNPEAEPPKITTHTPSVLQHMGRDVELFCEARGIPSPDLYWVGPNGKIIMDGPRFRVLENRSLVITSLKWGDMGEYKCIAGNEYGEDTAVTFVYPFRNDKK